jgi:hypothetical protein
LDVHNIALPSPNKHKKTKQMLTTIGIVLMTIGLALSAIAFSIATYYNRQLTSESMYSELYKKKEQWKLIGIGAWVIVWIGLLTYLLNMVQ